MQFEDIDPRPARRAGQAETEPIAQIGDLDRGTGARKAARASLAALAAVSVVGAALRAGDSPALTALLALTFAVAASGLLATWRR